MSSNNILGSSSMYSNFGEKNKDNMGTLDADFRESSDEDAPIRDDSSLEINSRGGSSLDFETFLSTPYL